MLATLCIMSVYCPIIVIVIYIYSQILPAEIYDHRYHHDQVGNLLPTKLKLYTASYSRKSLSCVSLFKTRRIRRKIVEIASLNEYRDFQVSKINLLLLQIKDFQVI